MRKKYIVVMFTHFALVNVLVCVFRFALRFAKVVLK